MGRRVSNPNIKFTAENQNQDAAKKIVAENPRFIANQTFDVFSYVKELDDVELRQEPLGDNISGYIEKRNDKFVIVINNLQSPLRQRFTLAHELGHYFLHKTTFSGIHTDVTLFRDANEDSLGVEYAANDFAAEMLMPEADFKQAIQSGQNTPRQLSQLFQVTEKAVLYRAYKLGIIKTFPN